MNRNVRTVLLLSVLLIVSAAGCGGKKPSLVELRLADGGWLGKLCKNPLPVFAEVHPEIHVIKDSRAAEADVAILDSFALADAIHKNQLVNFLPRMEEQSFDLRQFKDADIRHAGRAGLADRQAGGFYALPIGGGGPAVIVFNADLFRKDGVLLPDKRWEWTDFLDAAKKLTRDLNNDGKPDQYGFFVEPNIEAMLPWLWQAGGTSAELDNPKAVKGIEFYADLVRKHRVSPAPGEIEAASSMKLFTEGRIAMLLGGPECIDALKSVGFKWDIQVPPKGAEGSATTLRQFFCAARKESKHPDAAWELMNFLSSSFVGVGVVQSGLVPARTELFASFKFGDEEMAWNKAVWGSAYDIANHVPFLLAYDERHDKRVAQQLAKLLEGKASAEETAKAIVQITEDVRKKIE